MGLALMITLAVLAQLNRRNFHSSCTFQISSERNSLVCAKRRNDFFVVVFCIFLSLSIHTMTLSEAMSV